MTALSANKKRAVRNTHLLRQGRANAKVSTQFYEGGILTFRDNSGLEVGPASATAAHVLAGVANKKRLTPASPVEKIEFEYGHSEWFVHSGLDATMVGKNAFVVDDATVGPSTARATGIESYQKLVDGAANTATAETPIGMVYAPAQVVAVYYVPLAALTANDTDYATITVSKRTSAGASKTTVATLVTTVAGGSWTAFARKAFTLTATAADLIVASGSTLTFEIAKAGSGVAVPAGDLVVEFGSGTMVRVGRVEELETIEGTAGAWLSVGVFAGTDA